MTGPKILTLDIETSPNVADVWGLFKQTVSLSQLRESTRVISFAAKWYGRKQVEFFSDFHNGHDEMVSAAHALWDEADVVVHYNGTTFDMPHLRREFLLGGHRPPSPVQEIDLLKVVRSRFRFTSNKLDHVSRQLGLVGKVGHTGHDLWVRCMAGDPKAWELMRRYNRGDVVITEQVYDILRPWISDGPHYGLFGVDDRVCGNCGSTKLQRRGLSYTKLSTYQRYQCTECGSWSRGKHAHQRVDARLVSV